VVALVALAGPLIIVFASSLPVLSSSAAFKAFNRACKAATAASEASVVVGTGAGAGVAVAGSSNATSAALLEVASSFPPTSEEIVGSELFVDSMSTVNVAVDVVDAGAGGAGVAIVCMFDALTRKCAACLNEEGVR